MKTNLSRSIFVGVIISGLVLAPFSQMRADEFDDASQTVKDFDQATKDAESSMPSPDVRNAENNLDQAQQKLDELKNDSNADKDAKSQAESDLKQAQADADAARKSTDPDGHFTKQYDKYRDALKRRRDACKTLKKLIPPMEKEVQAEATGKQGIKSLREEDDKAVHKSKLQKARDRVKKCGQPPTFAMLMPGGSLGPNLAMLAAAQEVAIDLIGTGETIGHIADCKVQNLSDQPINCAIPPVILESSSGKNQNYVCPGGENVALDPGQTTTVPMNGVCVNRNKPPVGNGVGGDLVMNTGDSDVPADPRSHIPKDGARKLLRSCTAKYEAVDKLQKEGAFNDMPYKDKKRQRDIGVQWSTWTDPEICKLVGSTPATKEDLKKVVYKQLEPNGPMTPDTKKKVDQGIDTIFAKVELTTSKAKELEEATPADQEGAGQGATAGSVNVSNDTPTPGSGTQEKPKKKKDKEKKKKKWPKPIQDWVDARDAANQANFDLDFAQRMYHVGLSIYWQDHSPNYKTQLNACREARKKAYAEGATEADKDAADKACKEADKLLGELEKKGDFQKTDQGQKDSDRLNGAQKAADKANAAEKEAGKNIDPSAKEAVEANEKAVKAMW